MASNFVKIYWIKNGLCISDPLLPPERPLRDCGSAYLNSHFATVTSQKSLRDCDSTYLTKLANSRFATVALHI